MNAMALRQNGVDIAEGSGQPLAGYQRSDRADHESMAQNQGGNPAGTERGLSSKSQAGQQLATAGTRFEGADSTANAPDLAHPEHEKLGQNAEIQNQFGWAYPGFWLESLSFKGSFPFKGKGAGATLVRRIDRDQADVLCLMQFLVDRAAGLPLPFTLRVTRSGGEFGSGMRNYLRWCVRGAGQRGLQERAEVLALTPAPFQPMVRQLDADVRWINLIAAVYRRARSLSNELVRDLSTPGSSPSRDSTPTDQSREIT